VGNRGYFFRPSDWYAFPVLRHFTYSFLLLGEVRKARDFCPHCREFSFPKNVSSGNSRMYTPLRDKSVLVTQRVTFRAAYGNRTFGLNVAKVKS
jgi:hypothetical protein